MISVTPAGPELFRTLSTGSASMRLSGWPPGGPRVRAGEKRHLVDEGNCGLTGNEEERGRLAALFARVVLVTGTVFL